MGKRSRTTIPTQLIIFMGPKSPTQIIFQKLLASQENLKCNLSIIASRFNWLFYFQVMRTHGFDPTEEDLKDMIRNVDTNANGAIDFNEFIEMMVKGRGHSVEDDVVHAFKVFDRDGDGLISEEELRLTMTNLGEALTEAEVRHMIAEADMDGDGKINFAEFSRLMAHNSGPGGGAGANSGQSKGV